MKYQIIVGKPSGEVMYLPKKGIDILIKNNYLVNELIYDGLNIKPYLLFKDDNLLEIIDILSMLSNDIW
jgi:hypothetical protein